MFAQYYERRTAVTGREEQIIEQIFSLRHEASKKGRGVKKLFLTADELEVVQKELKVLKTAKTRYAHPSPNAEVEAFIGCHIEIIEDVSSDDVNEKVA